MSDIQNKLRAEAKKLLESKEVEVVIGYGNSDEPLQTTPCFITDPAETDRLVWNAFCENNLTPYLIGRKEKCAIVVRGCDARSLVVLINELQIERDNVKIIGVPCDGIIDRKKINAHVKGKDITEAQLKGDTIKINGDGVAEELKVKDFYGDCCMVCKYPNPVLCDVMVGDKVSETATKDEDEKLKELEGKSSDERWEYFRKELSKCDRCYACRNACPLCYCKTCFIDQNFPAWVGKGSGTSETMAFHIMRALHTTGRCVDCGACGRACPNDIDLRMLTKKIENDVKEMFDSEAGLSLDDKAPLTSYKPTDPEEFIK